MAIADVTIIPIGTKTPSVSEYVADVQNILEGYKAAGKIKFQLTPMNTLIEGELSDLFAVHSRSPVSKRAAQSGDKYPH